MDGAWGMDIPVWPGTEKRTAFAGTEKQGPEGKDADGNSPYGGKGPGKDPSGY